MGYVLDEEGLNVLDEFGEDVLDEGYITVPTVTIYRPNAKGELTTIGITDITDTTGMNITDTTGAYITDTGTLFTRIPVTIYIENDLI